MNTLDTSSLIHNKGRRKRLALAEKKLQEQMKRLEMPANALQRTVALYQAACRYECAVKPPTPEGMRWEPRYLPRPDKMRLDPWGHPKCYPEASLYTDTKGITHWTSGNGTPGAFGRADQVKMKPRAWRLVEYKLVPKNPTIQEIVEGEVKV